MSNQKRTLNLEDNQSYRRQDKKREDKKSGDAEEERKKRSWTEIIREGCLSSRAGKVMGAVVRD